MTHAFKIRGNANVIPLLSANEKKQGLITASTGNHGLGFSYISGKLGLDSIVVVPVNAPKTKKIENIKRNGSKIVVFGKSYHEASLYAHKIAEEKNRYYVHSFDDERIFAGTGTIFLEIIEKVPEIDTVIGPIGGGGLVAGLSFAAKMLNPGIKVFGVQSKGAPSTYQSLKSGYPVTLRKINTFADGIAVKQPGSLSFEYIQKFADGVLLVSDADIKKALALLHTHSKLVVEGAGAASVAALIKYSQKIKTKKVALIVTGGNIDTDALLHILQERQVKKIWA